MTPKIQSESFFIAKSNDETKTGLDIAARQLKPLMGSKKS